MTGQERQQQIETLVAEAQEAAERMREGGSLYAADVLDALAARLSGLQDTLATHDKVLFMAATAAHEYAQHKGDIERCNHHPCDLIVVKEVVASTRRAALALNTDGEAT